jgi:hypothetical protein
MKLFNFLTARNVQLTVEIAKAASVDAAEYSVFKKAEIDSANFLADVQCYLYRAVAIPKLLLHYILVNLKVLEQKTSQELAAANKAFINEAMQAKRLAAMAEIEASKVANQIK